MKTAEEYVKDHFKEIAEKPWFPVIVVIADSYSKYTHLLSPDPRTVKIIQQTKLEFYKKLNFKIMQSMTGELDLAQWREEVIEKIECIKCIINNENSPNIT
jgi:hypothetical protein